MLTPLFEVKTAENDKFISLAYDKNGNIASYRYMDGTGKLNAVNIPAKGFERLILGTKENGEIIYMTKNGGIAVEDAPLGL